MTRSDLSRIVPYILLLGILGIAGLLVPPLASAACIQSGESFNPVPPLTPSAAENATLSFTVVPSGATTFSRTHTIQMQTSLWEAHWIIQVFVNGIPQANQTATGPAAFISGYLLSYPTTNDVTFTVALSGNVPIGEGSNVTILQLTEIDTTGGTAPFGSITVNVPLAVSSANATATPSAPATTLQVASASPSPTQSGSYFVAIGAVALLVAVAAFGYTRSRR